MTNDLLMVDSNPEMTSSKKAVPVCRSLIVVDFLPSTIYKNHVLDKLYITLIWLIYPVMCKDMR